MAPDVITVATGGSTAFAVNASQLITASGGIASQLLQTLSVLLLSTMESNVGSIALDTIITMVQMLP